MYNYLKRMTFGRNDAHDANEEDYNEPEKENTGKKNKKGKKGKGKKLDILSPKDFTHVSGYKQIPITHPDHPITHENSVFYDEDMPLGENATGAATEPTNYVNGEHNDIKYPDLQLDDLYAMDQMETEETERLGPLDTASYICDTSIIETSLHDMSSKAIDEILDEFSPINNEVIKFMGSENDLKFMEIEEHLTLLLMRLDDVEIYGNDHIRKQRSFANTMVKGSLESLREKAKLVSDDVSSVSSFEQDNRSTELEALFKPTCPTRENIYEDCTENAAKNLTPNFEGHNNNCRSFDVDMTEEVPPLPPVRGKNLQQKHTYENAGVQAQNMLSIPTEDYENYASETQGQMVEMVSGNENETRPSYGGWNYLNGGYSDIPAARSGLQEGQKEQYNTMRGAKDSNNRHSEPKSLESPERENNNRNGASPPSEQHSKYCPNVTLTEPQPMNESYLVTDSTYRPYKNEYKNEPGQIKFSRQPKCPPPPPDEKMQRSFSGPDVHPLANGPVPVQLLRLSDRATYLLNEEGLLSVLDREDVRHRKIAVVSVVGTFRRGKSFLLNFMLRYLNANGQQGWLTADGDASVEGFSWRGGRDRDTTGILMWPEPFLVGDDLAVILLDTQGTFDNKTTMRDNTFIFALSTLVSSVQIFNLSERIQMDDLTNLQYFLEFGRIIQKQCDTKAFQKLIFLVRDWKFPEENQFGFSGGEEVLGSWLQTEAGSVTQHQTEMIRTCFREITCFLMPHPGERVSTDVNFKGALAEIKHDFLNYLGKFVESVLSPSNLVAKQVGRDVITARDLVTFMRTYIEQLQQPDVQPRTLFESMAELAHDKALLTSVAAYTGEMQAQLHTTSDLKQLHEDARAVALSKFDTTDKFGAAVMATTYRKKLEQAIHEHYERLSRKHFEHKEKRRAEEMHTHLENAFARYQGVLSALLVEADLSRTIEAAHEESRQAIRRVLVPQLQSLLSREQTKQELEKLDKKMLSFYNTLVPTYRRRCQRLQFAAQKEELRSAREEALNHYRGAMEAQCGGLKTVPNVDLVHSAAWTAAFGVLRTAADKYEQRAAKPYADTLKKEIQAMHKQYREQNAEKLRRERGDDLRWSLRETQQESLRQYRVELEQRCRGAKSQPDLEAINLEACRRALDLFKPHINKFGKEDCKPYFLAVKRDIQDLYNQYLNVNVSKQARERVSRTKSDAMRSYRVTMNLHCMDKVVANLQERHEAARQEALALFEPLAKEGLECGDATADVEKEIQTMYNLLERSNAALSEREWQVTAIETLARARTDSLALYKKLMNESCHNMQAGDGIEEIHARAVTDANIYFDSIASNFENLPITLENRRKLQKDIETCKEKFEMYQSERERSQNAESKLAVQNSFKMYELGMAERGCDGEAPLPTQELDEAHKKTREEVLSSLKQSLKNIGGNLSWKQYESQLQEEIEKEWNNLKERNKRIEVKQKLEREAIAKAAFQEAMSYYSNAINSKLDASDPSKLFDFHQEKRADSIDMFNEKAKKSDPVVRQSYLEKLQEDIKTTFDKFEETYAKRIRKIRETTVKNKITLAVGIDLGTTNSCVAVYKDGDVHIIKNNIGKKTTPSVIFFDKNQKVFGESAIQRGYADPENCVSEVKRIIGRKFDDPVVSTVTKLWNFKVTDEKDNPVIEVTNGAKKKWRSEEVSALVLGEMKRVAEVYLDTEVHDAVVTIPAYFNELQREATKTACIQAGLNVLRMINEPTAAAIAYGIQKKSVRSRTVLVYDFGGGTCDVSVLVVKGGRFTVKASQGDNRLGGEDFDDNMMSHVAKIFEKKHNVTLDKTALRRLRHQCERVKRMLTDDTKYDLEIENFVDKMYLQQTVQRSEFEEVNSELFTRAVIPVKKCLEETNMKAEDIDEIVLVGGSSRMPKIQQLLREFFSGKELNNNINPDEAIAYGAAIQAAISTDQCKDEICITDITPFSLGTDMLEDQMSIIIPKNTEIPCKKTKTFFTSKDKQSAMSVEVYQGENTKKKSLNTMLGEFSLTGLKQAPKGVTKADITFEIDENGLLHVTAKEVSSENAKSLTINKNVLK